MRDIALFDLDGTLADYDKALKADLRSIASPGEPDVDQLYYDMPPYMEKRRHIITSQAGWWLKLEKLKLGWDILEVVKQLEFKVVILTKGPSSKPHAWMEKLEWCNNKLGQISEGVTITHDKGLIYGKVLVDDWPDYIMNWLRWRPRGLVIMPAHPHNKNFKHPNVVRYDGTNLSEVIDRLAKRISNKN